MRTTPIALFPVGTEKSTCGDLPRGNLGARWHKQGGIRTTPESEEIHAEGLQKCIVWNHGDHLEVKRLIVRAECQGQGIGSAILRQLKRRGKRIVLYPLSDDGRQMDLERFYMRAGFVPSFFDPETWEWEP